MNGKIQQVVSNVLAFIKTRPALFFLLFLLVVIWSVSLNPSFYVLGWDNFSSYFNLSINIPRTIFATWREYRGVGVPSDSESVDLFRQLFDAVLHPFLPETLLDQVYMLVALSIGLITLYTLTARLFERYIKPDPKKADLIGGIAAFFYLCNLNTLATFYFPMIMYINRFFTLPLLFLLFFDLSTRKEVSKRRYLLYVIGLLFASGSFVTATILITIVIAMGCFFLFAENKKRVITLFLFYVIVNSFWLFPFVNYTFQRAKLIRLAPTFISANEIQLNKGKDFYLPEKEVTLYHEFFDAKVRDTANTETIYFSGITQVYQNGWLKLIIWLFPVLYLIGTGFLVLNARNYRYLLWIPMVLGVYLFLSMKEYSPFGFLYGFLNTVTPYFGVLFRFGDTKFHTFIACSGSILAAFGCYALFSRCRLRFSYILTAILILVTSLVYYPYVTGDLVGWLVYTKLPPAYKDITTRLNNDHDAFRVLHLPFDRDGYWKSYAWGAIGSSYLHFMLDHPLIDKTFEPASMENAYLDNTIMRLLSNVQQLRNEVDQKNRAEQFATLLRRTGVKYFIVDETVQTAVAPRGIVYWGTFNTPDVVKMGEYLTKFGMAKEIKRYDIPLQEYLDAYEKLGHNYSLGSLPPENKTTQIRLLEITDFQPKATFLSSVTAVDPSFTSLFESDLLRTPNLHLIQKPRNTQNDIYPFLRRDGKVTVYTDSQELRLSDVHLQENTKVTTGPVRTPKALSYVTVTVSKEAGNVLIHFYHLVSPEINGVTDKVLLKTMSVPASVLQKVPVHTTFMSDYLSDWTVLKTKTAGNLRIQVGSYTVPLPSEITESQQEVGTVAVSSGDVPVAVLGFSREDTVNPADLIVTQNPNCFNDGLEDSGASFSTAPVASVTSKNQSTCFFYDLKTYLTPQTSHAEVQLVTEGNGKDLDDVYADSSENTTKPGLNAYIRSLEKPNLLEICLKESTIDGCYNVHQFLDVRGVAHTIVPFEKPLNGNTHMTMFLNAKNTGYQQQYIGFQQMLLDSFTTLGTSTLSVPTGENMTLPTRLGASTSSLTVIFPKAISLDSFYFTPAREGLYGENPVCTQDGGGYKTYRVMNGKLVSYFENCFSQLFQKTNFSSDTPYVWNVSYNLLSGKYPRLLVADQFYSYADEYLSLQQGYPDVPGFKTYQNPELWYDSLFQTRTNEKITNQLEKAPLQTAYGYYGGIPGLSDTAMKEISIHQDSENEGMMLLSGFSFQPYPSAWKELSLSPGNTTATYHVADVTKSKHLLPSLWKLSVTNLQANEKSMLLFNEGFDSQWKLYDSWMGVFFGLGKSYSSNRCDGFANCYEMSGVSGSKTLYAFYTPERLMVLGWIVTIGGIFFFGRWIVKKNF